MGDEEIQDQLQFEGLIQGLIDNDYGCCDDFLDPSVVLGLWSNIQRLSDLGSMKTSGIGNKADFQKDKNIRGDRISWIDEWSTNEFEMIYLRKIEKFISYLNATCFTSIKKYESHYAAYEAGSFYKRHIDQFKNEKGRQFSIVLYLNDSWLAEDGGLLTLYPLGTEQISISPLGGRMVLFRSDEMEHEVHASFTRERSSIAGWLKN